ncbi:C2 family cysteine protease [Brachybacterium sp. AOP25-B2-12]|uniref:C2 family cysteine protease n=1 Tax=Brachybacterium sp. AOP25-B2-12 TaxID=3457710 RepID=UPI004033A153
MNGFYGADVEALIDWGLRAQSSGRRLDELARTLDAAISGARWEGGDGEAFREVWNGTHGPSLRAAGSQLDGASQAVGLHAAEQEIASDVDGRIDATALAGLIGGRFSWSDVINGGQAVWDWFQDPLTIDDLGGRYIDSAEGQDFDPADVDLSAEAIAEQTVRQGSLGDCWFLAGLMAVAGTDPDFLAENIVLRPDGTWDVTLYEDGDPVTVNVSADQLAATGARVDDDGAGNFWADDPIGYMSIYEQAAINHLGPDYESVIADTPGRGLELITGAPAPDDTFLWGNPSLEDFGTALDEGRPITVMSDPLHPWRDDISTAHVYQVQGVDESTGELILVNPWGNTGEGEGDMPHVVRVSIQDYNANFVMAGVGGTPDEFGGDR